MQELKLSNNTAKLHQMFGKKLYASKFSFISEICQNAVDSHRMAKQREPVIVGIKDEGCVFYVKDIGLSFVDREDFVNKVCTILESGKSEDKTNDEDCPMGMHGIGSISVSAYQPVWKYTVITPDKKKFTCVLREIEGKGLTYDISDDIDCDEEKSVLFEVNVQPFGLQTLITAMKEKLAYFKDIMFEFDAFTIKTQPQLLTLNTTFKIFQTDEFQYSTLSNNHEMHISLDQYSYSIRWHLLGISPISVPVGLKFSLADGLVPDITRENLTHTDNYKSLIINKIQKVASWFVAKYNETTEKEHESLQAVISRYKSPKAVTIDKKDFMIDPLIPYTKIAVNQVKFKGVSTEVLARFIARTSEGRSLFKWRYEINNKGNKIDRGNDNYGYSHLTQSNLYLMDKTLLPIQWKYLKEFKPNSGIYSKKKIHLEKGEMSYSYFLSLPSSSTMKKKYKETGVNIWRRDIEEFKILEKAAEKEYFIHCDDIVIPDSLKVKKARVINKKEKISLVDMEGEIGIKYSQPLLKASSEGWNCKFVEKIFKIKDLKKQPHLHIYATEDKRDKLNSIYVLANTKKKKLNSVTPCIITERQQFYIKKLNLHNFMEVDDFFKGKHDVFRKMITSYLISCFKNEYTNIFSNATIITQYLSKSFGADLKELDEYSQKYNWYPGISSTVMASLLEIAKEGKLYDLSIWDKFNNVKKEIDKFDFVYFLASWLGLYTDPIKKEKALEAMMDIAKQRKIRMNWENYKILED